MSPALVFVGACLGLAVLGTIVNVVMWVRLELRWRREDGQPT